MFLQTKITDRCLAQDEGDDALEDTLIAFKPDNPRGLAAEQLKETAEPFFKRTLAAKSQAEALAIARKIGEGNHAIVCFGSLSTMAGWYQLTGRKSSDEEYRQNY